eukprot:GILI01006062.1.p1 GENE.GILI01006062.1~~GILI01006062.1.p1  ORF type:complete len:413 (+),score=54.15 GILI01006062.1:125-1363(+)
MGCASSVPPAQPKAKPQQVAPIVRKDIPIPIGAAKPGQSPPIASSEAKYMKNSEGRELSYGKDSGSMFCDDDGCATVATNINEVTEDNTSAHRYVDFVARERRSIAQSAAEPSAFASAIAHKYRVARAYVKYGINGDVDQYQDEVDRAVPVFSTRAKHRVWDWMSSVVQAPPRGTKIETIRLFKRVRRGSVMSDLRKSISISKTPAEGKSVFNHKDTVITPDDMLDELLMGTADPIGSLEGDLGKGSSNGNNPAFALPANYGLIASTFEVGTIINVEGDGHMYDLIVVEEEAQTLDDDEDAKAQQVGDLVSPRTEALLAPRTPNHGASSHSHSSHNKGDTSSSVNSKEHLDYMSVSNDGDRRSESDRHLVTMTSPESPVALEKDPICLSIHMHNSTRMEKCPVTDNVVGAAA